jgi:hypothetical protein
MLPHAFPTQMNLMLTHTHILTRVNPMLPHIYSNLSESHVITLRRVPSGHISQLEWILYYHTHIPTIMNLALSHTIFQSKWIPCYHTYPNLSESHIITYIFRLKWISCYHIHIPTQVNFLLSHNISTAANPMLPHTYFNLSEFILPNNIPTQVNFMLLQTYLDHS